ncbi:SGNH/GDSL hydrolase family protein [Martelella endophytica]|uniref:Arylesterase n=1 Tax=Martelella endophytica TaxID=1486262 RepID=A0A0D5LSL5_MAREN|nr:SGNH/GDSL hydrolase family protein [Martelella endophytica]AJY46935.1 arylesterase [Martelella endophytica]
MKTVLCYGDSLTFGHDPIGQNRHAHEDRWPMVLQKALGEGVYVLPEALGGRTTAYDDHTAAADRNGARLLPTILASHTPIDLVIIMLGTNDLKPWTGGGAFSSRNGLKRLIEIIRSHPYPFDHQVPEILVVAPPHAVPTANDTGMGFLKGIVEQSQMLSTFYSELADEFGCGFFDAASVSKASPADGVHLDAENTRAIGRGVEPMVRMMLGL